VGRDPSRIASRFADTGDSRFQDITYFCLGGGLGPRAGAPLSPHLKAFAAQ
jgi:hypothetical protein